MNKTVGNTNKKKIEKKKKSVNLSFNLIPLHGPAVQVPHSKFFPIECLHTLPMSDDLCMWESVQHPAAASWLLYFMDTVTGFCHLNHLEADE